MFSPHTSWDAVNGGINNWLLEPYGSGQVGHCLENYAQGERKEWNREREGSREEKEQKCKMLGWQEDEQERKERKAGP